MVAAVKLALSILCEHPGRRTGLSTLFHEWVSHALRETPDLEWLVFAGRHQPWDIEDPRVTVVRTFPGNERPYARLWADHWAVGPAAQRAGAAALVTVGFMPWRAPLPVVMHLLSLHHRKERGWKARYRHWAVERGLRHAHLVLLNSRWAAEQVQGAAPRRVSYEGLQHDRFHPSKGEVDTEARQCYGLPERYVLWSSNFYRYKRAELALQAMAQMPAALQAAFPLVAVGGDWEGGLQRAKAEAARLGLRHVHFLGWVEDRHLPALYRGAALHVLPTAEETFGRSVVEAMACGCPVLAQDLPVLREVAGDAAIWVDFTRTTEAAAAWEALLRDDAERARLTRAGLERAQTYSFAQLARERGQLIRAALEKGTLR